MRKLLFLYFSLFYVSVNAQVPCIQVNCPRVIQLPADSVTLKSAINVSYKTLAWSQVSGLPTAIANPNAPNTSVFGIKSGLYVYRLKIDALSVLDSFTVIPAPVAQCPPPVKVDTLAILALKVCPPPIKVDTTAIWALKICPKIDTLAIQALKICPPIPPSRNVISISFGPSGKVTLYYDSGPPSTL